MQETGAANVQMTIRRSALLAFWMGSRAWRYRRVVSSRRAGSPSYTSRERRPEPSICVVAASAREMSSASPCAKAPFWACPRLAWDTAKPLQEPSRHSASRFKRDAPLTFCLGG